jgi:arylsulfatase A-like enzyme
MSKKWMCTGLLAGLAFLQFSCTSTSPPPNIILILADDMGYSDLGSYGGEISTPNLDHLAYEGTRFTQMYNAARCCPTRASLITGLYPHQAGFGGMVNPVGKVPEGPYQGYLSRHSVTIAEVLKDAGYYTAASGKWHVGEERPHWPTDRGFDNYYGLISGAANYFDISRGKAEDTKRHFAMDSAEYLPPGDGFYMTDAITEHAVSFLEKAAVLDQPFFLFLPYTAPHWPLHAKQEDIDKYRGTYMKGWDRLRQERYGRMVRMGLVAEDWLLSTRDPQAMPWDELSEEEKDRMDVLMSIYAAQVDCMDQGIGEVIRQLEVMGERENTLIMFLSDNGGSEEYGPWGSDFWGNFWDGEARPGSGDSYHSYGGSWANLSNTPFRLYKKRVHEGGIATPFIVNWPAREAWKGQIAHHPAHVIDIMTTICELTGAAYPEEYAGNSITPMPGKSLLPALQANPRPLHEAICWEHQGNRAIRRGNWKLVAKQGEPWELYDLSVDRSETNNLIDKETSLAGELKEMYEQWAGEVGVYAKE